MSDNMDSVTLDKKLSLVIDTMRFPLIFLVVIAHMVPFEQPQVTLSWNMEDIYVLVSEMLSHNLAKLSVRCYFLISGYYFFKRYCGSISRFFTGQLTKKWRTLLLPYIIWNSVLILAIFFKHHLFVKIGLGPDEGYEVLQNSSVYQLFWGMPINFPLWYIRDLMCMMLLSPLFFVFFKYTKHFGMIILALLYFFVIESRIPGLSTTAFFFFGLGSYLALNGINILVFCSKNKKLSFTFAVLLLVLATFQNGKEYHEYCVRLFIFFGTISIINLFSYLSEKSSFRLRMVGLAPLVFFIYVAHEIYIINWLKGAFFGTSLTANSSGKLLVYFVVPVLCILVCILLFKLLKRTVPRLLAISIGGRLEPNDNQKGK